MSGYVGIDVHRKRSQIAVLGDDGSVHANRNVPNGINTVLGVIGDLPIGAPVAFEAAYGWGWLVELLEDYGFEAHLVHPSRCKAIASARLKNDKVDAAALAQLLRADLLPEGWIAPLPVRQRRALLRHRCQLVRLRTLLRTRVHAVLAGYGCDRPGSYFTVPGRAWLSGLELPDASRRVVDDLLGLVDALTEPIDALDKQLVAHARGDPLQAGGQSGEVTALPESACDGQTGAGAEDESHGPNFDDLLRENSVAGCRIGGGPFVVRVEGGHRDRPELRRST